MFMKYYISINNLQQPTVMCFKINCKMELLILSQIFSVAEIATIAEFLDLIVFWCCTCLAFYAYIIDFSLCWIFQVCMTAVCGFVDLASDSNWTKTKPLKADQGSPLLWQTKVGIFIVFGSGQVSNISLIFFVRLILCLTMGLNILLAVHNLLLWWCVLSSCNLYKL